MTMNLKFLLATGCITLGSGLLASAQETAPQNVLLNKAVIEVAGKPAADSEGPEKLIDGDLQTKYCIIQSNPFVVIDAQAYYQFSSFKFHDCQTNEEEENASAYKLELSMDGKTWQTAAEADGVADIALKEINLEAPVKARYVRFSPTYKNCARMWELEGFGIDATTLSATLTTESLELDLNGEGEIKMSYKLKGDKAEDFAISTAVSNSKVEVGTPVDNNGELTIPVKGLAKGSATVSVKVTNSGEISLFEVPVKVKSDVPVSDADAVTITDWDIDVVAETNNKSSFKGFGGGYYSGGYAFYTSAVQDAGALCDEDGILETANGNVYKIPFGANNARTIKRNNDAVEVTFEDPIPTEKVNLLVFADAEDGININATIIYDDNSESDPVTKNIGYYEYETLDGTEAKSGLGLLENDYYEDDVVVPSEFINRVYEIELPADQYKNVKSISLTANGGSWGDVAYVLGVNAHNVNGAVVKHLSAELAEKLIKVKQGQTSNVLVKYTLTDIEGLTDKLEYKATANKAAIELGEITHDAEAKTITIPVNGVTPAVANVDIDLSFGTQTIKLSAQVLVKLFVTADTENCVEISSWAHDVIAEANPANDHSDQKLDDSGWVFFTDDIHPEGAIAGDERIAVAQSGNVYKFAPYNEKNATVIVGMGNFDVSRDFDFVTPIYTENINLLVTSANGESQVDITINYEDGSKEEVQKATVADWHAAEADGSEAVYGLGRVHKTNGDIANERNFRLFEINAKAQRSSRVKSINVNNNTYGSYLTVLGINAKDMKTSGISDVESDNTGKRIVEYYNLQGQKVEHAENGLYIVHYSDGTSAKIYIK